MSKIPALTRGQKAVLNAFGVLGAVTDGALATYVHHMDETQQSSSSVRSRRVELERKGLVVATGTKRLKSGRLAIIHDLSAAGEKALNSLAGRVAV